MSQKRPKIDKNVLKSLKNVPFWDVIMAFALALALRARARAKARAFNGVPWCPSEHFEVPRWSPPIFGVPGRVTVSPRVLSPGIVAVPCSVPRLRSVKFGRQSSLRTDCTHLVPLTPHGPPRNELSNLSCRVH